MKDFRNEKGREKGVELNFKNERMGLKKERERKNEDFRNERKI